MKTALTIIGLAIVSLFSFNEETNDNAKPIIIGAMKNVMW
jgi:hypothetical protein